MAQADVGDVHVNRMLTQVSVGYMPEGFIADQIFPLVGVNKQSDIIPFYDQSPWYRDEGTRMLRAPGSMANKTGLTVDTSNTYFAVNNALGADIPYEIRDNQDSPYDMERDVSQLLTGLLQLRRDRAFATSHMATGVWGTDFTVSNKWSDYALSTPLVDMRAQQRQIRRSVGRSGNMWVLGDLVWQRLQDHPDFVQRLGVDMLRVVSREALAALLEIPAGNILVGESMFTSSAEGVAEASATYADVWDDDALCLYTPPAPSMMTPAAGYTLYWRNSIAPTSPQYVRRWDDDEAKKIVVEVHSYFAQKRLLTGAGQLGLDVVD